MFQPVFQPFGHSAHRCKRLRLCAGCPQQCQLTPACRVKIRIRAVIFRRFIQFKRLFRHKRGHGLGSALGPESPQSAGTGKLRVAALLQRLPVVGPPAGQRHRGHVCPLLQDGAAVFHGQVVVRLTQQRRHGRVGPHGLHCRLPGCRKAARPGGQLLLQCRAVGRTVQHPGGFQQQGSVRGLGPEHQGVAPGGRQQMHPGPCKGLCPRAGPGGRQGKHEVGPALQRGTHPHAFRQQRQCSPLGQPAAHGHRHPLRPQRPRLRQLPGVPVVEGVVLGNDACKLHRHAPFRARKAVPCPGRLLNLYRIYRKPTGFSAFVGRVYKSLVHKFYRFARIVP